MKLKSTAMIKGGNARMIAMRRQERTDRPCNEFGFGHGRELRLVAAAACFFWAALIALIPASAQRTERPAMHVTGYVIDAELDTTTHHIAAKAVVSFTAPQISKSSISASIPRSKSPRLQMKPASSSTASVPLMAQLCHHRLFPGSRSNGEVDLRVRRRHHRQ